MSDCNNKCDTCHPSKMIEEIEAAYFRNEFDKDIKDFRGWIALKKFLNKMDVMKPDSHVKKCPKCDRSGTFQYYRPTDMYNCLNRYCQYFCKRGEGLDAPVN